MNNASRMMALAALASIGGVMVVDERPQPGRREPSPAALFVGDGFDAFRIERAELKRARKAKILDGVSVKQRAA